MCTYAHVVHAVTYNVVRRRGTHAKRIVVVIIIYRHCVIITAVVAGRRTAVGSGRIRRDFPLSRATISLVTRSAGHGATPTTFYSDLPSIYVYIIINDVLLLRDSPDPRRARRRSATRKRRAGHGATGSRDGRRGLCAVRTGNETRVRNGVVSYYNTSLNARPRDYNNTPVLIFARCRNEKGL